MGAYDDIPVQQHTVLTCYQIAGLPDSKDELRADIFKMLLANIKFNITDNQLDGVKELKASFDSCCRQLYELMQLLNEQNVPISQVQEKINCFKTDNDSL